MFSVPVFNDFSVKYLSQLIAFGPFVVCPRCLKRKREEQEKAEETLKCVVSAKSLNSKGIASFVALDICKGVVASSRL